MDRAVQDFDEDFRAERRLARVIECRIDDILTTTAPKLSHSPGACVQYNVPGLRASARARRRASSMLPLHLDRRRSARTECQAGARGLRSPRGAARRRR